MSVLIVLIGLAAAAVIDVRCICVIYQTHWSTHPRGWGNWLGFGYSYIAVAGAATTGALFLLTGDPRHALVSVSLFLIGSAGLIVFDRRQPYCPHVVTCERRKRSL